MKVYVDTDELYPYYTVSEEPGWAGEEVIEMSEEQFLAIRDAQHLLHAAQDAVYDLLKEARHRDGR